MTTWNVPLQLNNLEAQIQQQIATGLTNPLNANVIGNGKYISGCDAPPFGTSAIICRGTGTFLIEDPSNNPLLAVANTGLVLGGAIPNTVTVRAPTVTPSTDSSTLVATTAFVQSAISGTPASNLSAVLTAGNVATNSITLNNTGVGANTIKLLPNNGATDPHIEISDGTTTNIIDKRGYTTRNSVQNIAHYLNFSDSPATGTGAIQKTAGIGCNPFTNTVSATTFVGALTGNADTATNATNVATTASNVNATVFPTFVSASTGNNPINVDTGFTYNPSLGDLTVSDTLKVRNTLSGGSVGVGYNAGLTLQGNNCVAVGNSAGNNTQSNGAVAVGNNAGFTTQGFGAVAVGNNAGLTNQGANAVAVGNGAGQTNQPANTIVLNASGVATSPATASAFYVRPVRGVATATPVLVYNTVTFEISYNTSSIKYKKNVIDLTGDTSAIYNIKAREYDSKDDDSHHIGYVAEELEECDTRFTWKNPDGSPEGIEWFHLLLYTIEEMKKLRERIAVLESK